MTHFAFGNPLAQSSMYIPCSPSGVTTHSTSPPINPTAFLVPSVNGVETYANSRGREDSVSATAGRRTTVERPPMGIAPNRDCY